MSYSLVMPMAGAGSRFVSEGYEDPKPLIPVMGKPMFAFAADNLISEMGRPDQIIFIIDAQMDRQRDLSERIRDFYPDANIISLNERTDGAACTVRAAGAYLHPDQAVVVANCDQYVKWADNVGYGVLDWMDDHEAGMLVFEESSRDPKWSYAELDHSNKVRRVAEKDPISDQATVGVYYWSRASMMFTGIGEMMQADDRTNGEFYLCPSFNYVIGSGYNVGAFYVEQMHGLGTPDDLKEFLWAGE